MFQIMKQKYVEYYITSDIWKTKISKFYWNIEDMVINCPYSFKMEHLQ